ncbi:MAG: AraC family transcriptional regulator [Paucibacter sp.]|nr:AraC family transcriptional regulator [Roseateles sp.]
MSLQPLVVTREFDEKASSAHSMLGLRAVFAEMTEQGIGASALLQGTGLRAEQLDDSQARVSLAQKITIFRNVQRLSAVPDVGLRAGARQRLSDFGVYGYALASSRTIGDAVLLGIRHVRLAGPVLEKRFRVEGSRGIFEAHDFLELGELLPLATEFWFASSLKLCLCVLEAPFPSLQLLLPYPRPAYAEAYERMFGCEVRFDQPVMEWHFDAAVLARPCPNANPITADLCTQFCERMLENLPDETELSRQIRTACLNSRGDFPTADEMAARMGMSVRSLHRRLAGQGQRYQDILDDVRRSLAVEFLRNTSMSVEQIAGRVGFSDASNFRKAFRKWTGSTPASYRQA